MMSRPEETNNRPGYYSKWHSDQLNSLKQLDRDWQVLRPHYEEYNGTTWVEYNQSQLEYPGDYEPVAFVESIACNDDTWRNRGGVNPEELYPIHKWKEQPLIRLAELTELPAFCVWHPHSCEEFYVKNLQTGNSELLSESRYIDLIEYVRGFRTDQIEPFAVYQADSGVCND